MVVPVLLFHPQRTPLGIAPTSQLGWQVSLQAPTEAPPKALKETLLEAPTVSPQ